jgi:hypothetical protein
MANAPSGGRLSNTSFKEGNMVTSDSWCASLQPISERGLGSFLQALAEVTPDEDLQEASDCWVHALEVADWSPGESSERFICRVTINALENIAELNSIRSPD